MVPVAIAAAAGIATGLALSAWIRAGRYRRATDTTRLSLSWAWVLVPIVAGSWAVLTAAGPARAALPSALALTAAGAVIGWIDLDVHRVPDQLLAIAAPVVVAAAVVGTANVGEWDRLGTAGWAAAALAAMYLVLALAGSMGLGDVKLAVLVGFVLGVNGWSTVTIGTVAAFAVAGCGGVVLLLRRSSRRDHLAFAPAMLAGAFLALLLGHG